jgi:hypothetical protein
MVEEERKKKKKNTRNLCSILLDSTRVLRVASRSRH